MSLSLHGDVLCNDTCYISQLRVRSPARHRCRARPHDATSAGNRRSGRSGPRRGKGAGEKTYSEVTVWVAPFDLFGAPHHSMPDPAANASQVRKKVERWIGSVRDDDGRPHVDPVEQVLRVGDVPPDA